MSGVAIIARYMALLADTYPNCAQKDPLTIRRLIRLMVITHMFCRKKHMFSPLSNRKLLFGLKTVCIMGIEAEVIALRDENDDIHALKEEVDPRAFISPPETDLIWDVMVAFADWDTDSLWKFIRYVIPPVYFPRDENEWYEIPKRCFEAGLDGVELVTRASAEYGERVFVWAKCGEREITPDSVIPVPEFEVIMPNQCDECSDHKAGQE